MIQLLNLRFVLIVFMMGKTDGELGVKLIV